MNLRKLYTYSAAGLAAIVLVGCGGGAGGDSGAPRANPSASYGQLVSGGKAMSNPAFASVMSALPSSVTTSIVTNMVVPMSALNGYFNGVIVCGALESAATTESAFCGQNISYVASSTSLFGANSARIVPTQANPTGTYVSAQAATNGVVSAKYDQIQYTAPGAPVLWGGNSTSTETASGLVVLPADATGKPLPQSQIKGVVIYYHPTVLSKAGVPSGTGNQTSLDYGSTFVQQFQLASIYTSAGYIVVAPDYIGQGVDINPVHPYVLIPSNNALSGIYMLPALNTYLQQTYNINLANLATPNLFISSYSEGGGYAMKASQLIQGQYASVVASTGLTLKRTVGVSGAYDLTNQMLPFAFSNTTNGLTAATNPWSVSPGCDPTANTFSATVGCPNATTVAAAKVLAQYEIASSKPPLGSYMVNAIVAYDYTPSAYNLVMTPSFAQQTTCLNPTSISGTFSDTTCASIFGTSYSVEQLFNPNGLDSGSIGTQLILAAYGNDFFIGNTTNATELLTALASGQAFNSVSYFIQPNLLIDPFIMSLVAQADTYNWTTTSPISILYLTNDSTITNLNSKSACNLLSNQGIATSGAGSLTCNAVNNESLWGDVSFGSFKMPIYLDHGSNGTGGILQMAALNQMLSN